MSCHTNGAGAQIPESTHIHAGRPRNRLTSTSTSRVGGTRPHRVPIYLGIRESTAEVRTEVDVDAAQLGELFLAGHLASLVPGEPAAELCSGMRSKISQSAARVASAPWSSGKSASQR